MSVSTKDTPKVIAFSAKTPDAPNGMSRRPPRTGPTAMPACTPIVMRPFAHEIWSSDSTRFGIAARDAEKNGSSAIADPKARTIKVAGACANTIARKNAAEIASDQIITLLRSKRSPSAPAKEPSSPATPKVRSRDSACMLGECVRCQTV